MSSIALYNASVLLGLLFLLYALFKHEDVLRIDKPFLKKYLSILLFFFVSSTVVHGLLGYRSPWFIESAWHSGINSLLAVFWEEGLFVVPFLILYKKFPGKKFLWILPFMLLSSFYFASGHAYQGGYWPLFTVAPLFSFWLSIKKGAGTSMILHICYDVMVVCCNYLIMNSIASL